MMKAVDLTEVLAEFEREEKRRLSPHAAKSTTTKGRKTPESPSPVRTEFQRDRDRIIHCKAFRRLKHKTQVFIAPTGDHFVTRLTHTLEVAQIARTISRALRLNEDLAEAIALAHDIGHPPFGHAGEQALADALPEGFRHAEQSLRVVEDLERLNLTWETRNGIVNSSKVREDMFAEAWGTPATFEGQVVKLSDAVAYINHDIGDAIRAGLITERDLPSELEETLGSTHAQRINTLVLDVIATSWPVSARDDDSVGRDFKIRMSEQGATAANTLREFMFQRVYLWEGRRDEAEEAKRIVRTLYSHYAEHPDEIQSNFVDPNDETWRKAADYVAGMTDAFALRKAAEIGALPTATK
jgi:dGTPase